MKAFGFALLTTLVGVLLPWTCSAAPVVPGLHNKHPLSEPQVGELLLGELRCLACHGRKGVPQPLERTAPDLSEVGSRVAPDYLRRFIASPSASHSGTTMPDLLTEETEDERNKIAEAITHFLVAQSPRTIQHEAVGGIEASKGNDLFHAVGCIVCHSPRDESGKEVRHEGVVELGHIPEKYTLASLGEFLSHPARVRPSGRMPDMKLTPVETQAIARYLLGKANTTLRSLQPRDELVAMGKKYFQDLNCASCHKLGDIPAAAAAMDLQHANLDRGCLAKTPGKYPRFHLSDAQSKAIRTALAKPPELASDKTLLATTLTAFNCIACHQREGYGGVPEDINPYFRSSERELGDDGRIPPPLTLVGAKLQKVTMKKVLFDGDAVRSYMSTRMPQFGEQNLRQLPDLFSRLDLVKNFDFLLPIHEGGSQQDRDREKAIRAAGRELIGDQGLSCIACHSFNGKTSNKQGIDLLTSNGRLQPSWFYHFLRDPNAFRPRTVMPTAWPGGQAVHKKILNGDTDRQIEAIWYYLSLGTSAQEPSGMRPTESLLTVTDTTLTYRGRSNVAGYRGIAVGFPEKLSYAFNAETGTLSAIWRGDFVRVNRSGQGSGGFNPAARPIQLAQDVSFYSLPDETTVWPLRPVMTKEEPVNPDPLYPKNRGYQFRGYYIDDASVPTFMYRGGDMDIEDRSTAGTESRDGCLMRDLTFDSPKGQQIWFRALTGKIEAESMQRFRTPELRLSIPATHVLLRPTLADKNDSELLLKIDIPPGKSRLSFTYELLK